MNNPPVAEIRPRSSAIHDWIGGSRLWLLTLLCLMIAVGLVWWSNPQRGTTIHIQFPEGHGLQTDDTVRFRGIEVGTVKSVTLDDSLSGVKVEVLLKPSASELATKGTRFWIVRPELSLTRISGLETAIGHKYIGVSPNPTSDDNYRIFCNSFQGLADVPVDTLSDSGVELTLRGDKKHSVSKGSAVTFRGVDIGTVLDVALSQDSRHVDVRVRIFDQHTSLLTSESKFWASSGIDLDFKFGFNGGFNLDTESLETLARGGVSMITTAQGADVSPGDVFQLHATADDKWFEQAAKFEAARVAIRGTLPVKATWQTSSIFGSKEKTAQYNAVAVEHQGQQKVFFPGDMLNVGEDVESMVLTIGRQEFKVTSEVDSRISSLEVDGDFDAFSNPRDLQSMVTPVDCLAVRKSEDLNSSFHIAIKSDSIKQDPDDESSWTVIEFNGDRDVWHGAPVVSSTTGKLVGVLLIFDRKTQILGVDQFDSQSDQ